MKYDNQYLKNCVNYCKLMVNELKMVLDTAYLLSLAIVFGGMVTFQVLFAPLIFIKLEEAVARPFIRAFFPYYYLYFALLSAVLCALTYFLGFIAEHIICAIVLVGFLVSRQILMPLANKATDTKQFKKFMAYHMATVAINTLQLFLVLYLLFRLD